MEKQTMRGYLDFLKKNNELWTCKKEVSPQFELGALLEAKNGLQPMFFPVIKGYKTPVVGGLYGDRRLFGDYFGLDHRQIKFKLMEAMANPGKTTLKDKGPVKDRIHRNQIDLMQMFPVPTFHEKDSFPFITAGILVARDLESNQIHTSVRRFQVFTRDKISVLIESPKLLQQFLKMEEQGLDMEVAVVLGYHPAYLLASQVKSDIYCLDKNEVTAGLLEEPLDLVRCETVDLTVPAGSEIVLEGRMKAQRRQTEGPFGEMVKYYGPATQQPYMEVTCVLHREDPIFQVIFPSTTEHVQANGLLREVGLYTHLQAQVDVREVHLTTISGCRYHALVSIKKKSQGDGKSAILAALASNKDVKHVIIVDDDVDVFDKEQVEWALATRVQADNDILIIPGALGSPLEPSHVKRGVTAKMGIDATKPINDEVFSRVKIPGYQDIKIENYFE